MQFRHEVKHPISLGDKAAICASLSAVAQPDPHAGADGQYLIRSLYFDNVYDKALREKANGMFAREKFRIRYYNDNLTFIRLEKKVKRGDLGYKVSAPMTADEVQRILNGDTEWMLHSGRGLIVELYAKMTSEGLRPRTDVEYTRTPFVYELGNVRVTVDEQLRMGVNVADFLKPGHTTIPAGEQDIILEVKWDEFLPAPIKQAVQLKGRRASAFSKYATCRMMGM